MKTLSRTITKRHLKLGRDVDVTDSAVLEGRRSFLRRVLSRFELRLALAVAAGKLVGAASRLFRLGGGTTLPGVVAKRLDSGILRKLSAELSRGVILITGTNGKTTTSRILASILESCDLRIVSNRGGANLESGIVAALLRKWSHFRGIRADWGVFEVDEAALQAVAEATQPRIVIITNLFRDQLDRYGEIDYLASRWKSTLDRLKASSTVVLNVDDPRVAALGIGLEARTLGFGVETRGLNLGQSDDPADSTTCPLCGAPLTYASVQYSHLGRYSCPNKDFARPTPDLAITSFSQHALQDAEIEVDGAFGSRKWSLPLPGLYNGYNLLAAAEGALVAGAPMSAIESATRSVRAAFGRFERISLYGRSVCVVLVKNPVGLTEVVRTILSEESARYLAILVNDHLADGTDVSWLWDADLHGLAKQHIRIVAGGTRAKDLALRLKYAGVPLGRIDLAGPVKQAVRRALELAPVDETLYVLPTYTAMMELERIAAREGSTRDFWKN